MNQQTLITDVRLTDEKVGFSGYARHNPEVKMDYFPPFGEGNGYTGLEMLLLSLSACSGTAIAVLLRRMGRHIRGFEIHAVGMRQEELPMAFNLIDLEFRIQSTDVSPAEVEKAIALAEQSMCPVWAMLKGNVTIETRFTILS